MSKKGFTLIEIIAVIVILGLLLVLVMPNILTNLNVAKGKVSEATQKVIEEAASLYIDQNPEVIEKEVGSTKCFTVGRLINAGLLVDPVIDAETRKKIDEDVGIRVTITNDGRTYEIVEDETCANNEVDLLNKEYINLSLSEVTTKGFTATTEIDENYKYKDEINIIKYEYSVEYNKDKNQKPEYEYQANENSIRITNLEYREDGIYKVKVRITTDDGQVVVSDEKEVKLVEIGNITFSSNPSMNVCANPKEVTVTNPESNIYTETYKTEKLTYSYTFDASLDKSNWTKPNTTSYSSGGNELNGGKYKVKATANGMLVTRVTDGVNEKVATFTLSKVETTNPVIYSSSVDKKTEKYYAGKITLRGRVSTCTNNKEAIREVVAYCLTTTKTKPTLTDSCWSETDTRGTTNAVEGVFGRDNGTYYGWVKDSLGQISDKAYPVTVNWDKVPSCKIGLSGTEGDNDWYRSNVTTTLEVNTAGKEERDSTISTTKVTTEGTTKITGSVSAGGKEANCTATVKKDATNPTCGSYTTNNRTSYPKVNHWCEDSGSGCTSSGWTYSQYYTGYSPWATFYDKAGNSCQTRGYANYVEPDSFTYSCGCSPKYTVDYALASIYIGSSKGSSSISCSPSGTCTLRIRRTQNSTPTGCVTATKGSFSRSCCCTAAKNCKKVQYYCCFLGTSCQWYDQRKTGFGWSCGSSQTSLYNC